jgi:molybdopterin/thiamine biosynthesis adenylyltransferase
MPDGQPHADAIAQLDAQLKVRWPGATQLGALELRQRFPSREGLVAAWRVPGALQDAPGELLVSVDRQFPWTLPRIALPDATNAIGYPHVETDGQVCVAPSSAVYELPVGIRHVEALVADAATVLDEGRAGTNDDDFFAEAHSYWGLIAPAAGTFLLIEQPPAGHALLSAAECGAHVVLGQSHQAVNNWAKRSQQRIGPTEQAMLLALDAPLHPRDYPLTSRDLVLFAERVGAAPVLHSAVMKWKFKAPLRVVISFPHSGRRVYLGAEIPPAHTVRLPGAREPGIRGFRPKPRTATGRVAALSQNPNRFRHWRAVPIFRSFLRERTAGGTAEPLETCHVIVAGCGALGGQLAVQLAQAGVGRLTLLDNDILDWRNVGRHVLDGASVGRNKALALRDAILRRFPDAEVDAFARSWEEHFDVAAEAFDHADLVISATAEAASNLHLDSLSKAGSVAPVIFGWMEPFAVSAHAVFRHPAGPGLADLVDGCGLLLEPVVDRESAPPLPREPACGAFFQPYSSLSALSCVALVGELAVDSLLGRIAGSTVRTWVGPASSFHDNGLSLTPAWHERLNRHGFSRLYDRQIFEAPT